MVVVVVPHDTTFPLYTGLGLRYNKRHKKRPGRYPQTSKRLATPFVVLPKVRTEGGRHGWRCLIRLLGAAAAQSARPDPGRAGAAGRLRRDHHPQDRGGHAPAV